VIFELTSGDSRHGRFHLIRICPSQLNNSVKTLIVEPDIQPPLRSSLTLEFHTLAATILALARDDIILGHAKGRQSLLFCVFRLEPPERMLASSQPRQVHEQR